MSGLCFFGMRTIVYIDGFNLYYRMLKQNPSLKWLNLLELVRDIIHPDHKIIRVNYYTARVSSRAHDPDAPARQAIYFNALGTVPEIKIHEGNFLITEPWMPLATPADSRPQPYVWTEPHPAVVKVVKSEEKGSDVNLGAHLVRDAFTDAFDVGVVITNDSDLVEPIRIAAQEAGKRVGLLKPVRRASAGLITAASWHLYIRRGHLTKAQFPDPVVTQDGTHVMKPPTWV